MLLSYLQGCVNEGKKLKINLSESPQTQNKPSGLAAAGSFMQNIVNTMQNTPGYDQFKQKVENQEKEKAEKARLEAEVGKAAARISSAPRETNRPGIDVPHKWKSSSEVSDSDTLITGAATGAATLGIIGGAAGTVVGGPIGGAVGTALGGAAGQAVGALGVKTLQWLDRKQQEHSAKKFEEEQARNLQARREGGQLMADTQTRIQAQQKAQKTAERERAIRLGLPWTDEFGVMHNA